MLRIDSSALLGINRQQQVALMNEKDSVEIRACLVDKIMQGRSSLVKASWIRHNVDENSKFWLIVRWAQSQGLEVIE